MSIRLDSICEDVCLVISFIKALLVEVSDSLQFLVTDV